MHFNIIIVIGNFLISIRFVLFLFQRLRPSHSSSSLSSQTSAGLFISCKQWGFISRLCSPSSLIPFPVSVGRESILLSIEISFSSRSFTPHSSFLSTMRKINVCLPSFFPFPFPHYNPLKILYNYEYSEELNKKRLNYNLKLHLLISNLNFQLTNEILLV